MTATDASTYDPGYGPLVRTRVRIATWNVWGRYGPWEARLPVIIENLSAINADVLALQGKPEEAVKLLDQAARQHKTDVDLWLDLASRQAEVGRGLRIAGQERIDQDTCVPLGQFEAGMSQKADVHRVSP